jgi:RNase P protein component
MRRIARELDGARVVVRALPGAAARPFAELSRDIDRALPDALRKAAARAAR